MTPINTYFFASTPTTSLDGIPEAFLDWAASAHGWTREALLGLGQARYAGFDATNALEYFVGNFTASASFGKCSYCSDGDHGLTHNLLGHLECDQCSSEEYRASVNTTHRVEAEWLAAGCPDASQLDIPAGGTTPWDDLIRRRKATVP